MLAGYGAGPGRREVRLRFLPTAEGAAGDERLLVISGDLPHSRDPLVLAVLLKLLLAREQVLSADFGFDLSQALGELRWPDTPDYRSEIECGSNDWRDRASSADQKGAVRHFSGDSERRDANATLMELSALGMRSSIEKHSCVLSLLFAPEPPGHFMQSARMTAARRDALSPFAPPSE